MQEWAQSKCITQPSEIKLDELKSLGVAQVKGKYIRDLEGKWIRKVRIKNFDGGVKVGTPPYKFYKDWEKYKGYHSDQFSNKEFQLQMDLYRYAVKKSAGRFYSLNKQDELNIMEMPLYPLDIEKDMLDDFTVVLIGRRRSGKTWLSRWIMYHMRYRFPFGVVITGTRLNNFWSQYIPEEFIHDIEDIGVVLDNIFARQTFLLSHPELGIDPRMFIILDDVMSDKFRIRFSKQLSECFTNGRHNMIFTLITIQDPKGIGPDLRENTDVCLMFRVYEGGRKKVVEEEWLSYIENITDQFPGKYKSKPRVKPEKKPVLSQQPKPPINKRRDETPEEDVENKSKRKISVAAEFFWMNTGLLNPDTCEPFEEDAKTTDVDRDKALPQAIAVLQGRTTEDLQRVFRKAIAQDPGHFVLGDKDYWLAAKDGNYRRILNTYTKFKRRGRRRVNGITIVDEEEADKPEKEPKK